MFLSLLALEYVTLIVLFNIGFIKSISNIHIFFVEKNEQTARNNKLCERRFARIENWIAAFFQIYVIVKASDDGNANCVFHFHLFYLNLSSL